MAIYFPGCLIYISSKPLLVHKRLTILSHVQREPVLPVDLKNGLNSEPVNLSEPLDQDMFAAVFITANTIRDRIHEAAGGNMKKAQ